MKNKSVGANFYCFQFIKTFNDDLFFLAAHNLSIDFRYFFFGIGDIDKLGIDFRYFFF